MEQKRGYISWTKKEAVEAVESFIERHGRLPVAREMNRQNGLPSRRTFEKLMEQTFYEFGQELHPDLVQKGLERQRQSILAYRMGRRTWTAEKLAKAVCTFARAHGRLPEPCEYLPENGLPSYTVFREIAEKEFLTSLRKTLEPDQVWAQPAEMKIR